MNRVGVATAEAYWVTAPGRGELRTERIGPVGSAPVGQSLVETCFSGVSPGTERLVGRGEVPLDCTAEMACRYMAGGFDLPVKYGYSLVGRAVDGALVGQDVFVMHPHQRRAWVDNAHAVVLPSGFSLPRATLIPNTETALNAVWDADLGYGDSSIIVGAGPIGLLLAFVLRDLGLGPIHLVEIDPERRAWASELPFVDAIGTADAFQTGSYDVAFHGSGSGAGLQTALQLVGFEGCVVELSWYGNRPVQLDLGSHFHYQRKRILASQVAHVARPRRSRTSHADRMEEVLRLLAGSDCDRLLGDPVGFGGMPELMRELYHNNLTGPCPLIDYG